MPAKQKNAGNICQICLKYKSGPKGPFCSGHGKSAGKSGGGGSGGASGVEGRSAVLMPNSARPKKKKENSLDFDAEIISELLIDKCLTIKNDRESGMLTIIGLEVVLSGKKKDSLDQYMNALLDAFEQLKKESGVNGFKSELKRDDEGHIVRMMLALPNRELYAQFIAKLVADHLLPQQAVNQADKLVYEPNKNYFANTPFSTKPEPGSRKAMPHDDHAPQGKKKPGSLNPFDIHGGPKVKGKS